PDEHLAEPASRPRQEASAATSARRPCNPCKSAMRHRCSHGGLTPRRSPLFACFQERIYEMPCYGTWTGSPPLRLLSAFRINSGVLLLRNRADPSANATLAPPGCW